MLTLVSEMKNLVSFLINNFEFLQLMMNVAQYTFSLMQWLWWLDSEKETLYALIQNISIIFINQIVALTWHINELVLYAFVLLIIIEDTGYWCNNSRFEILYCSLCISWMKWTWEWRMRSCPSMEGCGRFSAVDLCQCFRLVTLTCDLFPPSNFFHKDHLI